MKISRTRHIPIMIASLTVCCFIVGEIVGKPFKVEWLLGFAPYISFIFSQLNKKKYIKKNDHLTRKKFKEWQWLAGIIPAVYPFLNWIGVVVFNNPLVEPSKEMQTALAGIISYLVAAFQGGNKNDNQEVYYEL